MGWNVNYFKSKAVVKKRSPSGYVYFIKSLDYVKIGFSKNVKDRIRSLQTASPVKLELIGYLEADKRFENTLHKKFKKFRSKQGNRHEWFHLNDEINSYIKSHCYQTSI